MSLTLSAFSPPRFAIDDPAGDAYLKENGYAVYQGAANADEVAKAHELFWAFLESLGLGIRRSDPRTWRDEAWPQAHKTGAIAGYSVGQSPFLWYCRDLKNIRSLFARIWGSPKLLVSFDGTGAFRPTAYEPTWKTSGGWYHFDQNGAKKFGLLCYQGLLNLMEAGPERGGLVVVPGSHLWHESYFVTYPEAGRTQGDFIRVPARNIEAQTKEQPVKLCCEAGDIILWDSRTIHCSSPALTRPAPLLNNWRVSLERLVAYICMTPISMAAPLERLLLQRRQALQQGITTNHWPHEFHPNYVERSVEHQRPKGYVVPVLNEAQQRLAGVLPYE